MTDNPIRSKIYVSIVYYRTPLPLERASNAYIFFLILGVLVTTFALSYGLWQLRTGNRRMSQNMMRLRIVGQGFTVAAVLAGIAYGSSAKQKKSNDNEV